MDIIKETMKFTTYVSHAQLHLEYVFNYALITELRRYVRQQICRVWCMVSSRYGLRRSCTMPQARRMELARSGTRCLIRSFGQVDRLCRRTSYSSVRTEPSLIVSPTKHHQWGRTLVEGGAAGHLHGLASDLIFLVVFCFSPSHKSKV